MILRSVVGKLWLTIIILVSLVLVFLTLFLSEQVDKTYVQDQQKMLKNLASHIQVQAKTAGTAHGKYLKDVVTISELFRTYMVVLGPDGRESDHDVSKSSPQVDWTEVLSKNDLEQVFQGKQVAKQGRVHLNNQQDQWFPQFKNDILLVAIPYEQNNKVEAAIVLYQTHDQLSEIQMKRWIFYSALIGIALTTVFAFFLSTRITQPLIQMKRAAEKMSRGEFSTRVPVRTHERDEIGDLAMTFNRMAGQLEDSIHQLSQEKDQLSSILRSMTDGVLTLNKFGKVILTNPPADKFLSAWDMTEQGKIPPPLQEFFQRVIQEDREFMGDITGQGKTWALVMTPLYARDQLRGAVAVLRDVSEDRRLDKMRKDFVANVSHELRTPLSMLQGYSEALLDDIADTPEERREIASVINEESQRMGRLVRELLDLARMEAGHIQVEPSAVSIPEILQRMARKFQTLAREENVQISAEFEEDFPIVKWDEDKIEQVLTNLIDNAIRHTPEGGSVCVRAYQKSNKVYLEVEDTGSGIPEEDLPFVFERFYKADKARTRGQSGGTGLGLSIVNHLVHAHGGEAKVRSQLGKGTVFIIQLPLRVD
ncbi:ATP-binding protein [Hazenella coriacea]|uniref:histidine kinase n=1 Tax=Hazenella coriacea TaxID=1179467 RepID=A0A4R3L1J2_9BACL|nr:ATP-binding protein [Hazenella coriacea]TCS93441.1 two-component system sensor histidine kinase ResE [Hazenella coriacea]